jgi:2-dehydro-3-deoxyglucarate aldolase
MKPLKSRLAEGQVTVGSWLTLAHPAIAEIMARAGFDWLTIDLEHSVITIREAEELIRVVVPMVNSPADAEAAVEAVRYPPMGKRGVGLARAQGYGSSFDHYKEWINRQSVVIVQVEHIKAVDNLEAILGVEGVDGFIVGPYDLSGSLGVPGQFDHPSMKKSMERIKKVGLSSGKVFGIHVIEPNVEELRQRLDEGYSFVAYSLDIRMLDRECRSGLDAIRSKIR